jgi:hypothetical protein
VLPALEEIEKNLGRKPEQAGRQTNPITLRSLLPFEMTCPGQIHRNVSGPAQFFTAFEEAAHRTAKRLACLPKGRCAAGD